MKAAAARHLLTLAWFGLTVGMIQENFYRVDADAFDSDKFQDSEILDCADKILSGALVLDYSVISGEAHPCLRA